DRHLAQRIPGERLDRDRHVLDRLHAALCSYHDFLESSWGRLRVACSRVRAQRGHDRGGYLLVGFQGFLPPMAVSVSKKAAVACTTEPSAGQRAQTVDLLKIRCAAFGPSQRAALPRRRPPYLATLFQHRRGLKI